MAEIDLEKKKGFPWIWLLAAALLVGVLAFFLWGGEEVAEEAEVVDPTEEPLEEEEIVEEDVDPAAAAGAAAGMLPIAAILSDPQQWTTKDISGKAKVLQDPTDRGFWIEQEGKKLFVLIDPAGPPGSESKPNVEENQMLSISGAKLMMKDQVDSVSGNLDKDSREIIASQDAFLVVDEKNLTIL